MYTLLQDADAKYGKLGPHQVVEFEQDKITLDLPDDTVELENGWTITPLTDLEVSLYCRYSMQE